LQQDEYDCNKDRYHIGCKEHSEIESVFMAMQAAGRQPYPIGPKDQLVNYREHHHIDEASLWKHRCKKRDADESCIAEYEAELENAVFVVR
jgi:hypothetical protein